MSFFYLQYFIYRKMENFKKTENVSFETVFANGFLKKAPTSSFSVTRNLFHCASEFCKTVDYVLISFKSVVNFNSIQFFFNVN